MRRTKTSATQRRAGRWTASNSSGSSRTTSSWTWTTAPSVKRSRPSASFTDLPRSITSWITTRPCSSGGCACTCAGCEGAIAQDRRDRRDTARARLPLAPLEQLIGGPRVHDPVDGHPGLDRLVGAVRLPLQLTGRVGIRIDREPAAHLDGEREQVVRRVEAFRSGVDLDRGIEPLAGVEHDLGVELRLRPATADHVAAGAVAEHVGVRVGDGGDHSPRHLPLLHAQLRVDRCDDDVEPLEDVVVLVEGAALEDVHLDPGQDAERRQVVVQRPTMSSCFSRRSRERPLAMVSRGEWSVSAMYSWPRLRAARAITSISAPPSLHSECTWRSPFNWTTSSLPLPTVRAVSSSSLSRYAVEPEVATSVMIAAVFGPMPSSSWSVPAATRATSSSGARAFTISAARR